MNSIKVKRTKQKIKNNTKYSIPFKDNILRVEAPAHKTERHLKFCIDFLLPRGNFIIIRHTSRETSIYVHLKHRSIKVKKGQKVRRGQVIALSGQVGFATYPHLHFGVYRGVRGKGGVSIKVPFDKKYRAPEIPLHIAEGLGKYL